MPAGRPTKYTPELLEKARHYILNYEDYDQAFPSDIGLAYVLQIGTTTLYRWAEEDDKEEFRDILDQINTKQQLVAWNKGLKGDYNANLVKLLLGKHGFHDKQDVDSKLKADIELHHLHDLSDELLEQIINNAG